MDAWLDEKGYEKGAVLGLAEVWELAKAWYRGRLDPGWKGRSVDASKQILADLGLTGPFWELG